MKSYERLRGFSCANISAWPGTSPFTSRRHSNGIPRQPDNQQQKVLISPLLCTSLRHNQGRFEGNNFKGRFDKKRAAKGLDGRSGRRTRSRPDVMTAQTPGREKPEQCWFAAIEACTPALPAQGITQPQPACGKTIKTSRLPGYTAAAAACILIRTEDACPKTSCLVPGYGVFFQLVLQQAF